MKICHRNPTPLSIFRFVETIKTLFCQSSLAWLLKSYVYALTEWSQLGGDDHLSAEDALDKATSTIEEIITIATQVKYLKGNFMVWEKSLIQNLFSVNLQCYSCS